MFFLFFTLSKQILENTHNLTIQKLQNSYDNSRFLNSNLFTYESTGDKDNNPLSNIFNEQNSYWIAKDTSTGNSRSAIFFYFHNAISLEKFLIYTAYVTTGDDRAFSGYPLKVNVYTSLNNNPLKLHTVFSGTEPTKKSWGDGAEFEFSEPVICDKIKIEFEKVTLDTFFKTNDERAIAKRLVLIGEVAANTLSLDKVSGYYANANFVNAHLIPSSSFSYQSNGDKSGKPIANAFDSNSKSYWVSNQETTDSFHSEITVTFNSQITLDAILMDAAYRTSSPNRDFDGFPTVLKIYTASGNEQPSLHTIFSGTPKGENWGRTQFVFKNPVAVKTLKIEFAEVTPDQSFSGGKKVAVAADFLFISGANQKFPFSSLESTLDSNYINSHSIPTKYLTYSSTGDKDQHPLSYAFDGKTGTYWAANDVSSGSSTSSIYVNFSKTVLLNTFLIYNAYATSNDDRTFHGFAKKLSVYTSLGREQLSLKFSFEGDAPTKKAFGEAVKYTFNRPILCDRIRLEFVEVTYDNFFTKANCAVIGELKLLGEIIPEALTITETVGAYTDPSFLQEYMVSSSSFDRQSNGDKDGKPISNAFDDKANTYWVSNKENTDDFKATISVQFYSEQNLSGFLFDSAYRSRQIEQKDIRYFDGFPTTLTFYVSVDGSDNYVPEAIFTGEPVFPWTRTQFVFKKPITCKKVKIEFTEVTADESFSSGKKVAVSGGIYFIKESYRLPAIPSVDGVVEIPQNRCNMHHRCDVNITSNNVITIDLRRSSFNKFTNSNNGGAISLINCGTLFEESSFTECKSTKGGGAIFFQNDLARENNFNIINVNFINCSAVFGGAAYIFSREAEVIIRDCNFNGEKLISKDDSYEGYTGGSALFLTVKNGVFERLSFSNCQVSLVKINNNFNKKASDLVLSNKKIDMVLFSQCTFNFDEPEGSLIYYIRGDNLNSIIKVSDCSFIGKLEKATQFIDGEVIADNSPRLIIDACKFSSFSEENFKFNQNEIISNLNNQVFNYKYSQKKTQKQSWKSIITASTPAALLVVLGIIIAALVIKKSETTNNNDLEVAVDGQSPSENQA